MSSPVDAGNHQVTEPAARRYRSAGPLGPVIRRSSHHATGIAATIMLVAASNSVPDAASSKVPDKMVASSDRSPQSLSQAVSLPASAVVSVSVTAR